MCPHVIPPTDQLQAFPGAAIIHSWFACMHSFIEQWIAGTALRIPPSELPAQRRGPDAAVLSRRTRRTIAKDTFVERTKWNWALQDLKNLPEGLRGSVNHERAERPGQAWGGCRGFQ